MSHAAGGSYVGPYTFHQARRSTVTANSGGFIRANGIDIHYIQAGQGVPLILLHGGLGSTNPIWAPTPGSYTGHMETPPGPYRVIAPDPRGRGRNGDDGGGPTA